MGTKFKIILFALIVCVIVAIICVASLVACRCHECHNNECNKSTEIVESSEVEESIEATTSIEQDDTQPTETQLMETQPTEIQPTETTEEVVEETTENVDEDNSNLVNLGQFKLTAYCNCSKCCGQWAGGATASGTMPMPNRTIAVDTSVIPFGTKVIINGVTYIAEDTGGAIKGNRIDVYMASHKEALSFGVQYAEVFMVAN